MEFYSSDDFEDFIISKYFDYQCLFILILMYLFIIIFNYDWDWIFLIIPYITVFLQISLTCFVQHRMKERKARFDRARRGGSNR